MRAAVERHYDSLSVLYRWFWGEHIHHGLWTGPGDTPVAAQERLVARLADRAAVGPGDRVLDVGCGYAAPARWLARERGCEVIGVTVSGRQARFARRRGRSGVRGSVRIARADAARLPFRDGRFDVVWVIECIEHLEDRPAFLRCASRLLRPGGRLALCSWLRGKTEDAAARQRVTRVCEAFLCPDLPSAADYRRGCEKADLRVRIEEDLTAAVAPTWGVLRRRIDRRWLRPLRWAVGESNRRFIDGFEDIAEAFATGAMGYGLFVAVKGH